MQNDDLGYLLHHVGSVIDKNSDQVLLERLGVSFAQFKILLILSEKDGSTQNHIATSLGQTEASISRQIKLMNMDGLINIRRSTSNRRLRLIFLSEKGYGQMEKAVRALNNYYQPIFDVLDSNEQQALQKALIKIKNYL